VWCAIFATGMPLKVKAPRNIKIPMDDPRDRLKIVQAFEPDLAHARQGPTFPHRGFLLWRLSDAGRRTRGAVLQAADIRNPSQELNFIDNHRLRSKYFRTCDQGSEPPLDDGNESSDDFR
jgi:hypothetical protein